MRKATGYEVAVLARTTFPGTFEYGRILGLYRRGVIAIPKRVARML